MDVKFRPPFKLPKNQRADFLGKPPPAWQRVHHFDQRLGSGAEAERRAGGFSSLETLGVVRLAIFWGGVGMKEFHPTKWWGFVIEVSVFERWVE